MAKPDVQTQLPLAGIRVLDWTRLLPGPWCSQMLADLGADVIKIEQRGIGDPSRHNPPRYKNESVYFQSVNACKRSLTIDLKAPGAKALVQKLIAGTDVLMESFSASVAGKHGIDAEAALKANPKIVHCSISGYGQRGPLSPIPGHDLVVQAATGLLAPSEQPPHMPVFQTADYAAALTACIGILSALRRRDQYGIGAALDIAMFDSMFQLGQIGLASALARVAGSSGEPRMEVWGGNPRYALYPTKDAKTVAVSLLEARYWEKFCKLIGRDDLPQEYEDLSARLSSHGERNETYRQVIADYCLTHTRDEISREMLAHNIPVVPVLTPDEAVGSPHVRARGLVHTTAHPTEGRIAEIRNPLHPSGLVRDRREPAPSLGGDSPDLLASFGLSSAEIKQLMDSRTI
ncbi:CaiB/BaiF CoA transferase family protein [Pseudorhodoplanes sp.]|uniref:CaiB/BaiF CoA transferase family protein n=1 Tax=Pseudorhodoplanes sp. TaxID=1934341 RepID=UPI003D0F5B0D